MPTQNNNLIIDIHRLLVWAANKTAITARELAKTQRIKRSIKISEVTQQGNVQEIKISISKDDAPEAFAYEFGSGIWGDKGEKYPITPKDGKVLAFDWPQAANIGSREGVRDIVTPVTPIAGGGFEGGRAILPSVMHPGVKAEPYMKPALDQNKETIVKEFATVSVKALAEMIPTQTVIAK